VAGGTERKGRVRWGCQHTNIATGSLQIKEDFFGYRGTMRPWVGQVRRSTTTLYRSLRKILATVCSTHTNQEPQDGIEGYETCVGGESSTTGRAEPIASPLARLGVMNFRVKTSPRPRFELEATWPRQRQSRLAPVNQKFEREQGSTSPFPSFPPVGVEAWVEVPSKYGDR